MTVNVNDYFEVHEAKRCNSGIYVILCKLPKNGVTPWVTWSSDTIDGTGHRYSGYYAFSEEDARANYRTRSF